jgi:hypothetical protein
MTHGAHVVVVTLSEMQLGILVVDTRNSFVGRVPYDGKARALYGLAIGRAAFHGFVGPR